MGHHQLDALDEQILKLIANNARIPFTRFFPPQNSDSLSLYVDVDRYK